MRIVLWQREFFLVFLSGFYTCLTADTFFPDESLPPPPPEFIPVFPSPPPPPPPPPLPHVAPTDYLVSPKCSRFLNLGDKPKIMKMGEPLTLVFMSLIMACEDIICTKMYNASCSPQKCPRCKSYSGPGDHFKVQVEDTNGTDVGIVCNVRKMFSVYGISCIGRNGFANLTRSYVVRVYARQSNGTMVTIENVATVVLGAGDASIVNSGPGYWPTGNGLMVGSLSSFIFPVKDNYNNIKKDLSGGATTSDLNQFEGIGHYPLGESAKDTYWVLHTYSMLLHQVP